MVGVNLVVDAQSVKSARVTSRDDPSLEAGVRIYEYQDGILHAKTMVADDSWATVGSANMDVRSFRLNFEITAVVIDPEFARDTKQMFENDFADSRVMTIDDYDKKSFWFKLAVRSARLTAPIL